MRALTRQLLYDLVWAKPVRDIAHELGLSDVGLKKICARADIPVPQRGYWAKHAAGKSVIKPALPPRAPGRSDFAYGDNAPRHRWPPDPVADLADPEPIEPVFDELIESVEARVRRSIGKVAMIRSLEAAHPTIKRLLDKDEERRSKGEGRSYYWDQPLFESPFEQRRLKLLNSIFVGAMRMGAKPWISGKPARSIGVQVGAQNVSFSLDHPKAKKTRWDEEQVHGGKVDTLKLEIYRFAGGERKAAWIDEPGAGLETQLTDIVVSLIMAGEIQYRASALGAYRHALDLRVKAREELERRRIEAEQKERERLAEIERRRRDQLLSYARDLRDANDIRALVASVEQRARDQHDDGFADWAAWAHGVADRLDPLNQLDRIRAETG
jgi:hypothetical protein